MLTRKLWVVYRYTVIRALAAGVIQAIFMGLAGRASSFDAHFGISSHSPVLQRGGNQTVTSSSLRGEPTINELHCVDE
jgi:hypothetical protein